MMKFEKYFPSAILQPYIKYFVVSENENASSYKVFPSSGLVIGFQYSGHLSVLDNERETALKPSGITGVSDHYKTFINSENIGTILVFFTETGFTHFASHPANELFNLSISLDDIFDKKRIAEVEDKLSMESTDIERVKTVEQFFLSLLKNIKTDQLIVEAVKMIYKAKGHIRIKELQENLYISQSPFEKRFRKVVGTSPKKFASIIRFNAVMEDLQQLKSLSEICYDHQFFDQSHFIKDFKKFTGDSPEQFKRFL